MAVRVEVGVGSERQILHLNCALCAAIPEVVVDLYARNGPRGRSPDHGSGVRFLAVVTTETAGNKPWLGSRPVSCDLEVADVRESDLTTSYLSLVVDELLLEMSSMA